MRQSIWHIRCRLKSALLLVVLAILSNETLAQNVAQTGNRETAQAGSKAMGVDVSIYLFDQQQYERSILPAYRKFVESVDTDPLKELLRDAITHLSSIHAEPSTAFSSLATYESDIAVLDRKEYYSSEGREPGEGQATTPQDMRFFVEHFVGPSLIEVFCIPHIRGLNPQQNMSRAALVKYLYSESTWIENHFTFAKEVTGPIPEIKLGDWSRFFTSEEIIAFDAELSRIKRPTDEEILNDGFDNLRMLVHAAATNPNFKLLLVIS